MALTRSESNLIDELLKREFLDKSDVCGIVIGVRTEDKTAEMLDFIKQHPNANRDEVYDKYEELMGINPLTDEDYEILKTSGYFEEQEDE